MVDAFVLYFLNYFGYNGWTGKWSTFCIFFLTLFFLNRRHKCDFELFRRHSSRSHCDHLPSVSDPLFCHYNHVPSVNDHLFSHFNHLPSVSDHLFSHCSHLPSVPDPLCSPSIHLPWVPDLNTRVVDVTLLRVLFTSSLSCLYTTNYLVSQL